MRSYRRAAKGTGCCLSAPIGRAHPPTTFFSSEMKEEKAEDPKKRFLVEGEGVQ